MIMRIEELLKRQGKNDNIAIKMGKHNLTYKDWNVKSEEIANILQRYMSCDSKTVGIFLPNSIEYAIAYFSILYADKVIIPISIQSKEAELLSIISYCEIDVLITNSKYYGFIKQAMDKYQYKIVLLNIDSKCVEICNELEKYIYKSENLLNDGTEDDVAIMLHTSGTTSDPKRVMLTHSNIINNVESNIFSLKLCKDDKVLIALPMFFGYCNTAQFLTHIYLGASMVILDSIFMPKQFFSIVQSEKITNFTAVPSMLLMLLSYNYADKYDYSSMRYICFGGGFMPVEKLKELMDRFPSIGFVQTYGQTECSPRVTALLPENSRKYMGSVGKTIPNVEVAIVDENDNELNCATVGEIVVRGKNVMKGYYKHEEMTANVKRNGWLHTGDLGYLNEEGFLYLTGRIKNIIISSGINLYPEEIENVLMQNENVSEAYVYGKKHNLAGEIPVAKVVLRNETNIDELKAFCRERLADYKVPCDIEVVEHLTRTYNGKIKRMK